MKSLRGMTNFNMAAALVAAVVMVCPTLATAATVTTQAVPPASFLNTRVQTVNEMIEQIRSSSAVRARYCKLFKVSATELIPYMKKNVVESYVPATKSYTVWCASKTGRQYVVKQTFVAGTRVFALRNGTPVMKWACGNPLVSSLPAPPAKPQTIAKAPTVPFEKVAPMTEEIASEPAAEAPVLLAHETPLLSVPSEVPSMVPATLVAGSSEIIVPAKATGGFIPWIPIAGAAAIASTSLGGSTSTPATPSKVFGTNGGGGVSAPNNGGGGSLVPEPSPIVVMLIGLLPIVGLVLLARKTSPARSFIVRA